MPQISPDPAAHWTAHMQDILASDASIRDGLHDDDAIPFIEWGRTQAAHLATQMVADPADVDADRAGSKAHALAKLMLTINRAVVYRHKQGADWLVKVFQRLNQVSQQVYGTNAPVLPAEAIETWIAAHEQHSDGELLRDLMARYTPPDAASQPDAPATDASELPAPPGDMPQTSDDTPTSPTGDDYEQA